MQPFHFHNSNSHTVSSTNNNFISSWNAGLKQYLYIKYCLKCWHFLIFFYRQTLSLELISDLSLAPSWGRQAAGWVLTHLHLEVVADVAAVELGAEQFEFPVKQRRRVPVPVADQVQNLLVVGHGVHPCGHRHSSSSCSETLHSLIYHTNSTAFLQLSSPGQQIFMYRNTTDTHVWLHWNPVDCFCDKILNPVNLQKDSGSFSVEYFNITGKNDACS